MNQTSELWFPGHQTLYLKQQTTSAVLGGKRSGGVVPSKCIIDSLKCFVLAKIQKNRSLISHIAHTGAAVCLCQEIGCISFSQEVSAVLGVIGPDVKDGARRRQVLNVLVWLVLLEAANPFQLALSTHPSQSSLG